MEQLAVGTQTLELHTVPTRPRQPRRAWDAADEYVISELAPLNDMVVVGDRHGALTCAFAASNPTPIIESYASRSALELNRERNSLDGHQPISILECAETLDAASIDLAILRLPKSNNELVELLHRLRPVLRPGAAVVAAAMAKHIPASATEALETTIGPTTVSLARKKARLLHARFDPEVVNGELRWPRTWKAYGCTLVNHGGGFSPERLDAGTDLLLAHLDQTLDLVGPDSRIVDLGCGNGVIGLVAARAYNDAEILAIDDSALAIAATRGSWKATIPEERERLTVHHQHRLANAVDAASVDAVLVNPPFHDDRVVGDDTAWSMFVDAHKALRTGGVIGVVGNRHLAYHAKLKKIFGNVEIVTSNKRFVVLRSVR